MAKFAIEYTFSTVDDGNMSFRHGERQSVIDNREKFLRTCFREGPANLEDSVAMYVVEAHQNIIKSAGAEDASKGMRKLESAITADCIVTKAKGLCLFLLIADCIPLIVLDRVNGVMALAHLGWVDTDNQLASAIITHFQQEYHSKLADLELFVGPALHKESYRYRDPVQKTQPQNYLQWQNFLTDDEDGLTCIDNIGLMLSQLEKAGIDPKQINMDSCVNTATSQQYFSHYRDANQGNSDLGRFAAVVRML